MNWTELETILNDSDISELELSDIQRENIVNLLININNPNLRLWLNSTFNIDDETLAIFGKIIDLGHKLYVSKLTLSDRGYCDNVDFSSNKIKMVHVSLYPGDVTRLQQFLSNYQYQSWSVGTLSLFNLESESDWEGVAELLQSLHSVFSVYIPSNCQLSTNTLRQLWEKTSIWWKVNGEEYFKRKVHHFHVFVSYVNSDSYKG